MFRAIIAMLAAIVGVAGWTASAADAARVSCVVVSEATYADPAWRGVADALVKKHGGQLIRHAGAVGTSLPDLRAVLPDFVAFVAPPEEVGRAMVTQVHRMMRDLDEDPYTDALWGIVTGYEAADALRIVSRSAPLVIRRGMSSMGPGLLDRTEGGFCSSETEPGALWPQPTTPWTQTLAWADGAGRFTIETTAAGKWPDRPVMTLLPERITDITVTAGGEHKPLVTDNFLLVPLSGDHAAGERIEIAFRGSPLRRPPARAASVAP